MQVVVFLSKMGSGSGLSTHQYYEYIFTFNPNPRNMTIASKSHKGVAPSLRLCFTLKNTEQKLLRKPKVPGRPCSLTLGSVMTFENVTASEIEYETSKDSEAKRTLLSSGRLLEGERLLSLHIFL